MAKEKILIAVKTYPSLSKKYDELVCTAGFRENGDWIRIYPIPFRKLDYDIQYKKFQWIQVDIIKNDSDPRPESYKLLDFQKIEIIGEISTDKDGIWEERRKWVLNEVHNDLEYLINKANNNDLSLATFKPVKFIDFHIEEDSREWDKEKLEWVKARAQQINLFCDADNPFEVVDKIPYKFFYEFEDINGKRSKLMVVDWEIGALYMNSLRRYEGDEENAVSDVKKKYWDTFVLQKDIYLFLGTTREFHGWAKNPFVIIGVFYPNPTIQTSLF